VYTESVSKIGIWQGGALNLKQAKLATKQLMCKHMGDAGGFKVSGCPTQPEPIFESRAVYMIYIFWSCPNKEEAKKIILGLLDKRLIACASIFPEVESIYRWEGKIEQGKEIKVLLKTQAKCFKTICSYIIDHGSYKVPEILQVDILQGNPAYLAWVTEET
jgi:periplasmic divalent cation tolerance protein